MYTHTHTPAYTHTRTHTHTHIHIQMHTNTHTHTHVYLRLQRISSRINHIDGRGSRKDLRPQGSAAGSTTSSSEEQRSDHSRWPRGSRGSTRLRSGADVFYIHRYQVVAFLVISISPRCNLGLFQSGVGSAWMCLNTGSSVLVDCNFGSEAVDEEDSGGRLQKSAAVSTTSTEDDQGTIFVCKDQQQDQPHHRQRIQESCYVVRQRKGGRPLRYQDLQNLKYHQIQVVYFLILDRLEKKINFRLEKKSNLRLEKDMTTRGCEYCGCLSLQ